MADLTGMASYPGVLAVRSCSYTCSHGISPGVATLICVEQPSLPAEVGDLIITDGQTPVTIRGCRIDDIKTVIDGNERLWTISIKDRRWRWTDYGTIFGCYNQLDPHHKLIPWMIRSPTELATLCLQQMGEVGYFLNLPPGLDSSFGFGAADFQTVGIVFPLTGLNPPINWNGETPAHALQQVADKFGCRVVYDVIHDRVLVTPIGVGAGVPDGHIRSYGPAIKQIAVPDGIIVIGDPTKFQMRLLLEAVGEDWDGYYYPINQLSYTPITPGRQSQITDCEFSADDDPTTVDIVWTLIINGVTFTYLSVITDDIASIVIGMSALISASTDARIRGVIVASNPNASTIRLTGNPGINFSVEKRITNVDGTTLPVAFIDVTNIQIAGAATRGWDYTNPPHFDDAISTDRLTYNQAVDLARKSVFRYYRVRNLDASGVGPIRVPGYGPILRRQQLVLTDTKCEQIIPELPHPDLFDRFQILNPDFTEGDPVEFIENYYNGYSRDKPAVVYGSFAEEFSNIYYIKSTDANSPGDSRVFVDFSIDPVYQLVRFAAPVFRYMSGNAVAASELTLETGCLLREVDTNQFAAYTLSRRLRPSGLTTFFETARHPDVQLNVIGQYNFVRAANAVDTLPQITDVRFSATNDPFTTTASWEVNIRTVLFTHNSVATDDVAGVVLALTAAINASTSPLIQGRVTVSNPDASTLRITGLPNGNSFSVTSGVSGPGVATDGAAVEQETIQQATLGVSVFSSNLIGAGILEADPLFRANYYLNGMMLKYQVKGTQTVEYNTIVAMPLDGAISQVSWDVGGGNPVRTVVSRNCEHSIWFPPYPERRRIEYLRPANRANLDGDGNVAGDL